MISAAARQPGGELGRYDLARCGLRSFLLQGAWSYRQLQTVGWIFALLPGLRAIYPEPKARRGALRRVYATFNTNPYLATYLLGYVLRREQNLAEGKGGEKRDLTPFLQGPVAAVGDSLFWGTIRPGAALLGVMITLFAWKDEAWGYLGPAAFLILFNIPHLYFRIHGLRAGFEYGDRIAQAVTGNIYGDLVRRIHLAGCLGAGVMGAFLLSRGGWTQEAAWNMKEGLFHDVRPWIFLMCAMMSFLLLRLGVGPTRLLYIALTIAGGLTLFLVP